LTWPADAHGVPRFSPDANRPEHLVASIVALSAQTNRLALASAMEAARADSLGKVTLVVEQVCHLAVGAGVATGEIAWLVGELSTTHPDAAQLAEAGDAIAGVQSSILSVAGAVQALADSGGPVEIRSSADALRRAGLQLVDLLGAISFAPEETPHLL
jgi:methyl-accepting chemotaxis protein